MGKMSLEEATVKALYNQLDDTKDVEDVDGLIDDIVVVTDPQISTEEFEEVIDRAQEIVEDTPEGSIPMDEDYIGQYLLTCPICGGTFIEANILEPGSTCPICTQQPESFVVKGKIATEEQVAIDNGIEPTESGEEGGMDEPAPEPNSEETEEPNAEPEEENELEKDVASKQLSKGNKLAENKVLSEDFIDVLDKAYECKDVESCKLQESDEISELPGSLSKFIYDLDKDKGNAWSVQHYTQDGYGNKIIIVSKNGKSENTAEDIKKAVESKYNKLKGEITENKNGVWFYLKDKDVKTEDIEEDNEHTKNLATMEMYAEQINGLLDKAEDEITFGGDYENFLNELIKFLKDKINEKGFILKESKLQEEVKPFEEIINDMELADSYEDLRDAASYIADIKLKNDVYELIDTCENDGEDVSTCYSIVTSDLLDSRINDLNESRKVESYVLRKDRQNKDYRRMTATEIIRELDNAEYEAGYCSYSLARDKNNPEMEEYYKDVQADIRYWKNRLSELSESKKVESEDKQFDYMLLDRLKSDCEYYLGNGNRAEKHLWAGNVKDQIAKMKEIYNSLEEKPEWLTMEDIENYEKEMTAEKVQEEIIPNSYADKCPKCGSTNFLEIDGAEYEDGTQEYSLKCQDCGYIENDEFKLEGRTGKSLIRNIATDEYFDNQDWYLKHINNYKDENDFIEKNKAEIATEYNLKEDKAIEVCKQIFDWAVSDIRDNRISNPSNEININESKLQERSIAERKKKQKISKKTGKC